MAQCVACKNCGAYLLREDVWSIGCRNCEGRTPQQQRDHMAQQASKAVQDAIKEHNRQESLPPPEWRCK